MFVVVELVAERISIRATLNPSGTTSGNFRAKNRAFGCTRYLVVFLKSLLGYTATSSSSHGVIQQHRQQPFTSAVPIVHPNHRMQSPKCLLLCISVSCSQMACDSEKYEGSTIELGGLTKVGGWEKCKTAQGVQSPSPHKNRAFESGILVLVKIEGFWPGEHRHKIE